MSAALRRKSDGQIYDFDDLAEAQRLVSSGQAELAEPIAVVNPRDGHTYDFDSLSDAIAAQTSTQPVAEEPGILDQAKSYAKSFGRGALQGGTLGFADEISGRVESMFTDKTYEQARDESRANFRAAEEENPYTSFAGNIAGSIGTMMLPGGALKLASKVPGLAKGAAAAEAALAAPKALASANPLKTAMLANGAQGAANLVGASESEGLGEQALEGGVGAAVGAALPVAGKAAGFVGKHFGGALKQAFDPIQQRAMALGINTKELSQVLTEEIGKVPGHEAKLNRVIRNMTQLLDGEDVTGPGDLVAIAKERAIKPGLEALDEIKGSLAGQIDDLGLAKFVETQGPTGEIITEVVVDPGLKKTMNKAIVNSPDNERGVARAASNDVIQKILGAEDDLGEMLRVKQELGNIVHRSYESGKPTNEIPGVMAVYRNALAYIDNRLSPAIEATLDEPGAYRAAKELYETGVTMEKYAGRNLGKQANSASFLGTGYRDAGSAIMASTVAGLAGADPLEAGAVGLGAGYGGALLRATPGRLLRAKIGEALGHTVANAPQALKTAADVTGSGLQMLAKGAVPASFQAAAPDAPPTSLLPPALSASVTAAAPIDAEANAQAQKFAQQTQTLPKTQDTIKGLAASWAPMLTQLQDPMATRAAAIVANAASPEEFHYGMTQLMASPAGQQVYTASVGGLSPTKYPSQVGAFVYSQRDRAVAAVDLERLYRDVTKQLEAKMRLQSTGELPPELAAPGGQ